MTDQVPVGSSLAGRIVHLRSPVLRLRYRYGVYVTQRGYPDWQPYASAMVRLPPVPAGMAADEARLVDVLVANRLLSDALAATGRADAPPADGETVRGGTPAGWVWAHSGAERRLALVPAELHAAFRHRGGVGAMRPAAGRGLPLAAPEGQVRFRAARPVSREAMSKLEGWLGTRLPHGYRDFLLATNGGVPSAPAVHPSAGFLVDQPLFGLAEADRTRDLTHARVWFADRFTGDYLAVGPVQGGLLAIKLRGEGAGSVWYWDDDDPRDDDRYSPAVICRDLLIRCADDWPAFVDQLSTVPVRLRRITQARLESGRARLIAEPDAGAALPRSRRPQWLGRVGEPVGEAAAGSA
ncbi:SMI1/KNR4 family protein [Rugosimonospora acidiphila]